MNNRKFETGWSQNESSSHRKITTTHSSLCYCDDCWGSRQKLMTELSENELRSLTELANVLRPVYASLQNDIHNEIFNHLYGAMQDFQSALLKEMDKRKKSR